MLTKIKESRKESILFKTKEELIDTQERFIPWVKTLLAYDSDVLFHPTTEGKWSVAEIIAHLAFWDKYIAEETIPKMKPNARIESVEFQVLNDQASEYALSGVSFNTLIEELIENRIALVSSLKEKTDEVFFAKFVLNREEIDPYSGYPHTLYNYVCGFIWHDQHHKRQIESFLRKR